MLEFRSGGLGKSYLTRCPGASEKVENSKLKLPFSKPSCGGVFPAPPAGGLEWKFRVEVQMVATGIVATSTYQLGPRN